MDFNSTMSSYELVAAAAGLIMFLAMILAPAFIIRAILGGKAKASLHKPLRGGIVCVFFGSIAMYFAIMGWGHSRSYWPGWSVISYAVGMIVAIPFLGLIFRSPWKRTLRLAAIYIACQVLVLAVMALDLTPLFSMADGYMFFVGACLAVLPFTWIIRGGGPGQKA